MERSVEQTDEMPHADYVGIFVGAVLSLCDMHGFRRYPPEADTRF
jgi:hypothetical protein